MDRYWTKNSRINNKENEKNQKTRAHTHINLLKHIATPETRMNKYNCVLQSLVLTGGVFLAVPQAASSILIVTLEPSVSTSNISEGLGLDDLDAVVEPFVVGDLYGAFVQAEIENTTIDLKEQIMAIEGVLSVDEDGVVDCCNFTRSNDEYEGGNVGVPLHYQWGLDRIDQYSLPLDKVIYSPMEPRGNDTYVYVTDTGIQSYHDEFVVDPDGGGDDTYHHPRSRASCGFDLYGTICEDVHGHGTHVSSIIAGTSVGVAPQSNIVMVKVLGDTGTGSFSGTIRGLQWIMQDIKEKGRCAVVSMSLGGRYYQPLNSAIEAMVRAGVPVVVAAGNNNDDACYYSPASTNEAVVVGSSTSSDSRSYFSNLGRCVDIYAPGSTVLGASPNTNSSYWFLSGTSMAAPHVSGAIALVASGMSTCNMINATNILRNATANGLLSGGAVPNILLQLPSNTREPTPGPTPAPTGTPTDAPTPNPTLSCSAICKRAYNSWRCNRPRDRCRCKWNTNRDKCMAMPTPKPTPIPTANPTLIPTTAPTATPTRVPTRHPTQSPSLGPTSSPSFSPTRSPTSRATAPCSQVCTNFTRKTRCLSTVDRCACRWNYSRNKCFVDA